MEKSVDTGEYQVLSQVLVETRKGAGVRQVDLAEQLGTTQSFVSKLERGEVRIDIIQLRTVCQALNTTLREVVDRFERRLARKTRERKRSGG